MNKQNMLRKCIKLNNKALKSHDKSTFVLAHKTSLDVFDGSLRCNGCNWDDFGYCEKEESPVLDCCIIWKNNAIKELESLQKR